MKRVLKTAGVLVVVTLLTTLTIDATDALRGSQSALSILAERAVEEECPSGMQTVELSSGTLCVDTYENAPGDECPHNRPAAEMLTQQNIEHPGCIAVSEADRIPWSFVTFHQAKTICATRGLRLPTHSEWYEAALGTPDTGVCSVSGASSKTGAAPDCRSAHGVADMIGGVWEWVDGSVTNGTYNDRQVPIEGYVAEIDTDGVPLATDVQPSQLYGQDYFWSESDGSYAMMRGGYYGSGDDAGLFSVHAKVTPSFASVATGFRCVQTL